MIGVLVLLLILVGFCLFDYCLLLFGYVLFSFNFVDCFDCEWFGLWVVYCLGVFVFWCCWALIVFARLFIGLLLDLCCVFDYVSLRGCCWIYICFVFVWFAVVALTCVLIVLLASFVLLVCGVSLFGLF